jgi:hypothetical protein
MGWPDFSMFEKRKKKSSKHRKNFSLKKVFFEWLKTASTQIKISQQELPAPVYLS